MRITVVGTGYVGLVTAACLADSGNHVVGVDIDSDKVEALNAGRCPIYEPKLGDLLARNLAAARLRFTTELAQAVTDSRVIFIAVGTPAGPDGGADVSVVRNVAAAIGRTLTGYAVVVLKSTAPVGTCATVRDAIAAETDQPFAVVSNPEFLKEGAAVEDFLRPDRVVVGAEDDEAYDVIAELYKPYVRNNKPILRTSLAAAEMIKYASNAFLAARISFINEVAELCGTLGVDIDEVRRGMGYDARIGHHFLYPGIGYGGSCFPKDVQAMVRFGSAAGVPCGILDAVHQRNQRQQALLVERICVRLGADLTGTRLAVWGLAFKPNTDDVRAAPAIHVIQRLIERGAGVAVHDPQAMDTARTLLGDAVSYHQDAYDALSDAAALVTATEWMEYRNPDFDRMRAALRQPLIFDGRNIYDPRMMARHGFEYYSIGRPPVLPLENNRERA